MGVTYLAAFLGGLVSFLAPCVLPLIPGFLAYLAGTTSADASTKRREIFWNSVCFVFGFSLVFAALGVLLNTLLEAVAYDVQIWLSRFGGAVVILFGLYLTGLIKISWLEREHKLRPGRQFGSRYFTSFLFGLAFAAGWTPCVGPALGAVLGLAATGAAGSAFSLLLTYALGLGLPFLLVGWFTASASSFINRFSAVWRYVNILFGIILVLLGLLIFTQNLNRIANFEFLNQIFPSPSRSSSISPVGSAGVCFTDKQVSVPSATATPGTPVSGPDFHEISSPDGFINTSRFSLGDLVGQKVVLIDFWTYSCINCQRTTPCLNAWYEKYRNHGLEIVGIHTPEFEFEKDYQNVVTAVRKFGIKFPVVLDNDYSTWRAYGNRYWPRKYLIDHTGAIIYDHIGEGAYAETDWQIKLALARRATAFGLGSSALEDLDRPVSMATTTIATRAISPEIYFGAFRNANLGNGQAGEAGRQSFTLPADLAPDRFYLKGDWQITDEFAEALSTGNEVVMRFHGRAVYLVAGAEQSANLEVYIDGGAKKEVKIKNHELYPLYASETATAHELRIVITTSGVKFFTFTFG